MSPRKKNEKHETPAAKWVRTITTAFVLAAAAIGLAVPEVEGNNPHTTREETLEEKRKDLTDYHHDANARSEAGSGVEASVWSSPHYTYIGGENATLVIHNSNPQKSDVPSLRG